MLGYMIFQAFMGIFGWVINNEMFTQLATFLYSTAASPENGCVGAFGEGPTTCNPIYLALGQLMKMNKFFPIREGLSLLAMLAAVQIFVALWHFLRFIGRFIPALNIS